MEVSKIQDSISILITLQSAIDECLDVIKKERPNEKSKVHALISSQLLIYANSFLEEWETLGARCQDDIRVIKVRRIANPLVRRIKQWTDLNSTRNTFLAHNFRDKQNNNALLKSYECEINIPNGFGDYILLCGCIFCTKEILLHEFVIEYNELLEHLKSIKTPVIKKGIENDQQAMDELDRLIEVSESVGQNYVK